MNTDKTTTFMDSSAQQFVTIIKEGSYNDLLKLYYKYKGFYITGNADFGQGVVVQFMEEYCIDLKQNPQNTVCITQQEKQKQKQKLQSTKSHQQILSTQDYSDNQSSQQLDEKSNNRTNSELYFGDNWDIDFEDSTSEQLNSHYPSI